MPEEQDKLDLTLETGLEEVNLQNPQAESLKYVPQSDICDSVDTVVPGAMRYELFRALQTLDRKVDGVDRYVAEKLGYLETKCSKDQFEHGLMCLCNAFSAEQVDALALAIWNIENRGQSIIVADQTGVGKGRIAAGMVKYAIMQGKVPIFLTEKPNLFSDIYRDLVAIGADDGIPQKFKDGTEIRTRNAKAKDSEELEEDDEDEYTDSPEVYYVDRFRINKNYDTEIQGKKILKPFILNGRSAKTAVKDENGNILYEGQPDAELKSAISKKVVPGDCSVILATYSQLQSSKETDKMAWFREAAMGNIIIMDEAHNASGASTSGKFLMDVLKTCNVTFLSATFAKRPDNMPIYASKNAMSDTNSTDEELVNAILAGGVALQEIISSQLVGEGQMIRRERSFEGIRVNYITLNDTQEANGRPDLNLTQEHRAVSDKVTEILREIIMFQSDYVQPALAEMDEEVKAQYKDVEQRKGTSEAGIGNTPVFSGIFQLVSQLLFSVKVEAVAEVVIEHLNHGRKPVVAFANTMESFLNSLTKPDGTPVEDGDTINADFSYVLKRRLDSVLKYTVTEYIEETGPDGEPVLRQEKTYKILDPMSISVECAEKYREISRLIDESVTGITFSPIDVLIQKIEAAGYSVQEVTGRGRKLKLLGGMEAQVMNRMAVNVNDAFRKFNNNEVDCLLINQSGSTGASAHAIKTDTVKTVNYGDDGNPIVPSHLLPKDEVKMRVMVVLQPELDINKEVQKRGRVNRTGQVFKPQYDYVSSDIPAETRLMMMLQRKLKSLDANTSSNQKQSKKVFDVPDFLNKYGDAIVTQWLKENPIINKIIGDPLKFETEEGKEQKDEETKTVDGAALKVSGRIAILSTRDQEKFYDEVGQRYNELIEYLKQTGEYDLEVENVNLEAETLDRQVVDPGRGGSSVFARQTILEKCLVNNLKKPFRKSQLDALIKEALLNDDGIGYLTPEELKRQEIERFEAYMDAKMNSDHEAIREHHEGMVTNITKERLYRRTLDKEGEDAANLFEAKRRDEILASMQVAQRRASERMQSLKRGIGNYFRFFHVGRVVAFPTPNYDIDRSYNKAVFIGFKIDRKAKNPYVPSSISLKFAIAGPDKYMSIPASQHDILDRITAITMQNIYQYEAAHTIDNWDEIIKEASASKVVRYIITGNILQAYSKEAFRKGKLISYTTADGGIKKGILLPFSFDPSGSGRHRGEGALRVTVPILTALPIINGMMDGRVLKTNTPMSIMKVRDTYQIYIPASKKLGAEFQNDATLKGFGTQGMFEAAGSGQMRMTVEWFKMPNLAEYLDMQYRMSVEVSQSEFDSLGIKPETYADETVDKVKESAIIQDIIAEDEKDRADFEAAEAARAEAEAEKAKEAAEAAMMAAKATAEAAAELERKESLLRLKEKIQRAITILLAKAE